MSKEIDELREVFLTDVDEETRTHNEQMIAEWEKGLQDSQAMASWQGHDITKQIAARARETYKDAGVMLATSRSLTEEQKHRLWGQQDAAMWFLSMTDTDAVGQLNRIRKEIRDAIKAV